MELTLGQLLPAAKMGKLLQSGNDRKVNHGLLWEHCHRTLTLFCSEGRISQVFTHLILK